MKKILTYELFTFNTLEGSGDIRGPKISETEVDHYRDILKKRHLSVQEVEKIGNDIKDCSESFISDYMVNIYFNWGWYVKNGSVEPISPRGRYESDQVINMIQGGFQKGENIKLARDWFSNIIDNGERCLEVSFTDPEKLNIFYPGMESGFDELIEFITRYLKDDYDISIQRFGTVNPDSWIIKFYIIFK